MGGNPLDTSVLESMFGDDADLCKAILDEFANSATPYMAELDEALSNQSAEGVRSLAHKLKSSSRTIGAATLGDLCETLEFTAPDQDWASIKVQEQAVKAELDQVLAYIDGL